MVNCIFRWTEALDTTSQKLVHQRESHYIIMLSHWYTGLVSRLKHRVAASEIRFTLETYSATLDGSRTRTVKSIISCLRNPQ